MRLFKIFYIVPFFIICSTAIADAYVMPESPSQQHIKIVNQQLDQVEGIVPTPNVPQTPQTHLKTSEIVYNIAPEISYIRYHEPSLKVKEYGTMYGINGSYTYRPKEGNALNSEVCDMYRIEGKFSYGQVKYNGSNTFSGIDDYMVELRGVIGKDFNFNKKSALLTPYYGVGYRSLFDSLYEDKPGGYNRWIQYFYIPAGGEVMAQLPYGWAIGADAEYDFFIYGRVISYLGELGLGDLTNSQKHGFGVRGSIKLVKKGDHFNLIMEPFIRFWHIRNSDVRPSTPFNYQGQEYVIYGYEPNNNSLEIGGRLGIEF